MAPDDNSGARPAGPVVLRIKLRYDDVETMVQRFAPNVGKNGLFLPTKSIQPIGTEVKFELRLSSDTPVLVGLGRVKQVKPPDPAAPKNAFGMAIELMRVSREGRELIIKMIERRRAMGLPDVAIPIPEDVDAARKIEGTQPRGDDTSGIVRDVMPNFASAPVAEAVLSQPAPTSGPIGVAKPAVAEAAPEPAEKTQPTDVAKAAADEAAKADAAKVDAAKAEAAKADAAKAEAAKADVAKTETATTDAAATKAVAEVLANDDSVVAANAVAAPASANVAPAPLLTSPRDSGPIPTATIDTSSGRQAVISLAPERAKPARVRVADLIAKAGELSGPLTAPQGDGLDEHVDMERALVRARALAGSDLEGELAALREVAAAPLEISIEAASAELARQLGGKPIAKRPASAKWVAPPAVEMRTLIDPPARSNGQSSDVETKPAVIAEASSPALVVEPAAVEPAAVETRAAETRAAEITPEESRADDAAPQAAIAMRAAETVPSAAVESPAAEPITAFSPALEPAASAPSAAPVADSAAPVADSAAPVADAAAPAIEPVAEAAEPVPATPARTTRPSARDRLVRGRTRKAPEPPPAESLEDPPTVIPDGDPDAPKRASASSIPTEPSVPAIEAASVAAEHVAAAPVAEEPEYGFEEKTRIPTGEDIVAQLHARERRSFSNIDEESLRTEPGQRPSSSLLIDDSADAAMLARAIEGSSPAMRLSDADIVPLDDGENTQIGQMPTANAFANHGYPTHVDQLSEQLDRQLADAEAEADNDFRELDAPQPAYQISPYANQGYVDDSQPQQFRAVTNDPYAAPAEEPRRALTADPYATAEEPGEEISDFDVLAEADEADADLLAAHGEADVAHVSSVAPVETTDDFAARLDLGDDDPASEFEERQVRAAESRRQRRASSDISYTVAERVPQSAPPYAARPVADDFDEPHGFANAKPTTPGSLRYAPPAHAEDLEDALAALDVDLEDNAVELQRRTRSPSSQRPLPGLPVHRPEETGQTQAAKPRAAAIIAAKPAPASSRPAKGGTAPPPIPSGARKTHTTPPPMPVRTPPKRATTDDGIVIDFDDDE